MSRQRAHALACLLALLAGPAGAAQGDAPVPRIIDRDGSHALLVDGAPYLVLGAQVNNSSAWPALLDKVWPAMEFMHANTAELPVYWEQFEPEPGRYDYSVVDVMLREARSHDMRLVLLWFATWKNGNPHYMPGWMKLDAQRYPRLLDESGRPADSPAPFSLATQAADASAFAALMRHLRQVDGQRTVLMVQVENEPGTGSNLRDHSAEAQRRFAAPVPPEVLAAMHVPNRAAHPTWLEAFGPDAEVCFHNWSVARYIGEVAAAGKREYALPLYVNAAPGTHRCAAMGDTASPPLPYAQGGPSDNIIPIWKVAAPALDMISPDNYARDAAGYVRVLDMYRRGDNALYVPETGGSPRLLFAALGHQAIGFAPFGQDFTRVHAIADAARPRDELLPPWALTGTREFAAPFAPLYQLLAPMQREVARLNFEGRLQAVAEQPGVFSQPLAFAGWDANVSYGVWARYGAPAGNPQPMGGAMVAQLAPDQFLVAGFYCRVDFTPRLRDQHRQFLRVEEGSYVNGAFTTLRLLNGDQTDGGLDFSSEPLVLRVTLATY